MAKRTTVQLYFITKPLTDKSFYTMNLQKPLPIALELIMTKKKG